MGEQQTCLNFAYKLALLCASTAQQGHRYFFANVHLRPYTGKRSMPCFKASSSIATAAPGTIGTA